MFTFAPRGLLPLSLPCEEWVFLREMKSSSLGTTSVTFERSRPGPPVLVMSKRTDGLKSRSIGRGFDDDNPSRDRVASPWKHGGYAIVARSSQSEKYSGA